MSELSSINYSRLWVIPLSNSDNLEWLDNKNFSKVKYNPKKIKITPGYFSKDILFAVSKKYPKYEIKELKKFSSEIRQFINLRTGDSIIARAGKRKVVKMGLISSVEWKTIGENYIEISIEWFDEIHQREFDKDIFDEKADIQKVNKKMLRDLHLFFVIAKLVYRKGPPSKVYYIKYNQKMQRPSESELNLEEDYEITKEDKGGEVSLFFGTNRNRTNSDDVNEYFGDKLDKLTFGYCKVSIPKGHKQGEIEKPFKFLFIEFSENPEKHIVLKKIQEYEEAEFLTKLSNDIKTLPEKSALIFIHGYNTSYAEAAKRTAQIAWDIPFTGLAGFFSWPSSGNSLAYFKDIENADSSVPDLENFIEKIISLPDIEKLHLIAHSMGNRLLTFTLNNLSDKPSVKSRLSIINQIVLGSPDIDQNVFKKNILPKFKNIGIQRTLYSSDKDKALDLSQDLRGGLARLGDAGDALFVDDGIDTIDASNVKSNLLGHSYIFDTKELLSDLYYLLGKGLKPKERRLREIKKKNIIYWLFPE